MQTHISLKGSRDISGSLQLCGKCGQSKPTNGGCQMTPTKWICSGCWKQRQGLRALQSIASSRATATQGA